eukprot:32104-Prorocentrum_minimum.AAC.1
MTSVSPRGSPAGVVASDRVSATWRSSSACRRARTCDKTVGTAPAVSAGDENSKSSRGPR